MSNPSTWAAVSPSTNAARRRERGSVTRRELANEAAQSGLVSEGAQAADHGHGRRREHRMTTLRLARVNVREVHFDVGDRDRAQRVANGETRVRVRAGVDDDAIDLAAPRMNAVDHLA